MTRPTPPLDVLIVEDEALIALDLSLLVEDQGHRVVAEADSLDAVTQVVGTIAPNLVFLDLHLAKGQSGFDVCRLVQAAWKDSTIVFLTANPDLVPAHCCGAHGVISKPFTRSGISEALRYLEQGICRPPPHGDAPECLAKTDNFKNQW
ncbi:response regulator [Hyphomicrobium sp.]|uniref:response regulator n=1 Tax=Hyphomicrobium sp. TaxID=82 RepID=UPI0025B842B4|nr:response regulator [Hyphomicrobium sp.]